MILAIHVVVIGGLLLQGCSKDKATTTSNTELTTATNSSQMSTTPDLVPAPMASNTVASTATPLPATSNATPAPVAPANVVATPAPLAPALPVATPVATPTGGKDYVIAAGDTIGAIAKRNGVTVKAMLEANPGIEPKKLQIGHKLQIPMGSALAATTSTPATGSSSAVAEASAPAAGDATTYTVKAGDRLIKIASTHGTTVKAIQALNDMKTTAIKVGQKIKLPVMKVASAVAGTASPAPATTAN
jgi:LysM repeat protein